MSLEKMSSAARVRRLMVGVLACGGVAGAATPIALASASAVGAAGGRPPTARAAGGSAVKSVHQTMVMSVSSITGNTIKANGQEVSGQINGSVSFDLTLKNGSLALASFTIYNNGHMGDEHRKGTVRGAGTGHYHVSGAQSGFSGQILSVSGTEEFTHAKNLGIKLAGTLNRRTYKLTVTLTGKYIE